MINKVGITLVNIGSSSDESKSLYFGAGMQRKGQKRGVPVPR